MSRVIEGQRIQRISIDALPTKKPKGHLGEKIIVFQHPEIQLKKGAGKGGNISLDAKLDVRSLGIKRMGRDFDPTEHSNASCPDASCPASACNTPQTGTQAKSCCIDCN